MLAKASPSTSKPSVTYQAVAPVMSKELGRPVGSLTFTVIVLFGAIVPEEVLESFVSKSVTSCVLRLERPAISIPVMLN